jgi:hypothetical protein
VAAGTVSVAADSCDASSSCEHALVLFPKERHTWATCGVWGVALTHAFGTVQASEAGMLPGPVVLVDGHIQLMLK